MNSIFAEIQPKSVVATLANADAVQERKLKRKIRDIINSINSTPENLGYGFCMGYVGNPTDDEIKSPMFQAFIDELKKKGYEVEIGYEDFSSGKIETFAIWWDTPEKPSPLRPQVISDTDNKYFDLKKSKFMRRLFIGSIAASIFAIIASFQF